MASFPVLTSVLQAQTKSLALWSLALAGVTTMYAGLYPFFDDIDMEAMVEDLPEGMIEALGYDQIGRAEEDGIIELELTSPVSRSRIYLERLLALALGVTQLVVVVLVVVVVINQIAGLEIATTSIVNMCLSFWVFSLAFASLSFAVGAATGRRSVAAGIASAIALAGPVRRSQLRVVKREVEILKRPTAPG